MNNDIPFIDENPVGMEQNGEERASILLYDADAFFSDCAEEESSLKRRKQFVDTY